MPTAIHETFIGGVGYDIISQLHAMDINITRNIKHTRSADPKFENNSKHSPDSSYTYLGSSYPHLVIEVSYPQKQKHLARLADTYIVDSDGNIGVVIGFDIEYKGTRKAKLSVWRPR